MFQAWQKSLNFVRQILSNSPSPTPAVNSDFHQTKASLQMEKSGHLGNVRTGWGGGDARTYSCVGSHSTHSVQSWAGLYNAILLAAIQKKDQRLRAEP